jgi:hypothetical protein
MEVKMYIYYLLHKEPPIFYGLGEQRIDKDEAILSVVVTRCTVEEMRVGEWAIYLTIALNMRRRKGFYYLLTIK